MAVPKKTMPELAAEQLVRLYEVMLRIRRFEERVMELFMQGRIPGFAHSYIGQEAVAAGVCALLRADDYVISNHRGHGHLIAKGADLNRMMAELYGRRDGLCRGKSGSMHLADMRVGVPPATGIVGGGLPIAMGAAYAAQVRGTDQVAVSFFGEGASGQGTFHEALNMAALWQLPVVFVCEVNQFAELMPSTAHVAGGRIAVRAEGYGIPGIEVDGNDVLAVYEATAPAVQRARGGEGPTLIEAQTARWFGHYIGDPQRYRSAEDIEAWRARDPIALYGSRLLDWGTCDQATLDALEEAVAKEVDQAVAFAEASELPGPEELMEHVYAP